MDTLENKASSAPLSTVGSSQSIADQLDSLRHMVTSIMVLVVIISGAFNIYLWRQVKYLRQDVSAYRPQAAGMVNEFERTIQPQMREFLVRVQEFGRAHPNDPTFTAIMNKYSISNLQFSNAPAGGSARVAPAPTQPAPAPAPAPAKK